MLGLDLGKARSPLENLDKSQELELKKDLERIGFFDWYQWTRDLAYVLTHSTQNLGHKIEESLQPCTQGAFFLPSPATFEKKRPGNTVGNFIGFRAFLTWYRLGWHHQKSRKPRAVAWVTRVYFTSSIAVHYADLKHIASKWAIFGCGLLPTKKPWHFHSLGNQCQQIFITVLSIRNI